MHKRTPFTSKDAEEEEDDNIVLDEQQQEEIIATLKREADHHQQVYENVFYKVSFMASGLYLLASLLPLPLNPLPQYRLAYLLSAAICLTTPFLSFRHPVTEPLAYSAVKYVPFVVALIPPFLMYLGDGWTGVGVGCLPLVLVLGQWYAIRAMGEVREGVEGLEGFKYKYKGA
ncbi:uncharacterized protein SPPG_07819 [Spizellomyces punctatus DAOM BR117]|uniref:Uncharacterized protein n=1 Tax=Spizellomyces punctatus (strain DAOM BR117) TaxID=645134 RepID=A0A0L0H8J6_SPIPD|nr:uncharacterized protein SPPG_07819 [Spizellomyces punctatus DAOM BR117]KNC97003.1 hypothetical protein SPPG_07819 [Spizellomyces punctatus DAOM BR117]|eukprot:XP_016605043.1 hypothetical protein SPPG_07819 [Spizellomyces punctatus DAOM BR117]